MRRTKHWGIPLGLGEGKVRKGQKQKSSSKKLPKALGLRKRLGSEIYTLARREQLCSSVSYRMVLV